MKIARTGHPHRLYSWLLVVVFALSHWPPAAISMQMDQALAQPQRFEPGVPRSVEMAVGEAHFWHINLSAGDYLRLTLACKHDRLAAQLFAPDPNCHEEERPLLSTSTQKVMIGGAERQVATFLYVASVSGNYRLQTSLLDQISERSTYEITIEPLRPVTPNDKIRIEAVRTELEGDVLANKIWTPEELSQGIAKYEASLAFRRELGDRSSEVRLLTRIGALYRRLGDLHSTYTYHDQARQIAEELGELRQVANLLISLGHIQRGRGESQQALDSFSQARKIFASLSDSFRETGAIHNIGRVYLALGEARLALGYFKQALQTYTNVGNTLHQCGMLNLLGLARKELGENKEALALFEHALEIARKHGYLYQEGVALGGLGGVYLALGDRGKAADYYDQLLTMGRRAGDNRCIANALQALGNFSILEGEKEKALDYLNQALNLFRRMGVRQSEAHTLYTLARINYSMGDLDEARAQIEAALEIKESMRSSVSRQDLRASFFGDAQSDFDIYIDLLMSLHRRQPSAGYDALALRASERARARGLLEQLAEINLDLGQGIDPQLRESARTLHQQLNAKAAARARAFSDLDPEGSATDFDREIAELTSRYRDVEAKIRDSNPRYAALTRPEPLTVAEIRRKLLDQETILLEFALGEERSWLWVVTPQAIASRQLPSRSEIENAARTVYGLLTAREPKAGLGEAKQLKQIAVADAQYKTAARELSHMLFGPIADSLCGEWKGKRLLIVADGALQYLPFGALPAPDLRASVSGHPDSVLIPLIADHEIVNLPSASVLEVIRRESAGRVPAHKMLAVLADPVFEADDPRLLTMIKRKTGKRAPTENFRSAHLSSSPAGSSDASQFMSTIGAMNRGSFGRLPFSIDEAKALAELVPANSLLKATSFQASRTMVMSGALSDYRIIHFATHGLLNSEHPELSGLVLSLLDKTGKTQDGFLRMHDIYNLRLPAEIVVLSACQTGLGKMIKGEGLIGLTRGFMYAGAQRVVASLWRVDDYATADLMGHFYHKMLKDGRRPAAALRMAQLEMMKQKRWASPYFWAAFVIQGEWR